MRRIYDDTRKRTFDNGKVSVTFRTEEEAKNFDDYLESTFSLKIDGVEVDSWKVKDRFNPYEFFNIDRGN
jgi:hypothetical protein